MGYAAGPCIIKKPLFISIAQRLDIRVYSDAQKKKAQSIVGKTVTVKVKDAGGTTETYTATATNATLGKAYITITAASHTTVGTVDMQVLVDGIPKRRFKGEFVSGL